MPAVTEHNAMLKMEVCLLRIRIGHSASVLVKLVSFQRPSRPSSKDVPSDRVSMYCAGYNHEPEPTIVPWTYQCEAGSDVESSIHLSCQ